MKNREYRNMTFEVRQDGAEPSFLVEGYASTFEPYKLIEIDGEDYNERIEPTAFDEADMSDVVYRIDHEGRVYARSSAGTINLDIDERGLHHITDLSKTSGSREHFEDIEAGLYPQMSFAFTVGADHYDAETRTRIIDRIDKVFDISAVSFPANPNTEIHVRDYFNGVIEMEKAAEAERQKAEEARRSDLERRENLKRTIMEVLK
ncbi:MAG: HK97 family phage prohead protease [Clostridiales bacterium]|nr:HK97 family phage prohead protease [Clostridiales bacterium]